MMSGNGYYSDGMRDERKEKRHIDRPFVLMVHYCSMHALLEY